MPPALIFLFGFAFALCMVGSCMAVEVIAKRGERIYRARHRDHSSVPSIHPDVSV